MYDNVPWILLLVYLTILQPTTCSPKLQLTWGLTFVAAYTNGYNSSEEDDDDSDDDDDDDDHFLTSVPQRQTNGATINGQLLSPEVIVMEPLYFLLYSIYIYVKW